MKIALAQTRPVVGDIDANIADHCRFAEAAAASAAWVVFPELSLTGYEPGLAEALAVESGDRRFEVFQRLSDRRGMGIAVGVPTRSESGRRISALLFGPGRGRQVYSKQYLHGDEEPFFVGAVNPTGLIDAAAKVALAICYELSVPAHAARAAAEGARIYTASAAKTAAGVAAAHRHLAAIARQYGLMTLMVNSVGSSDGMVCGGRSAAWGRDGHLLGQLDETAPGLLLVDCGAEAVERIPFN